jgi:hypothetical protein
MPSVESVPFDCEYPMLGLDGDKDLSIESSRIAEISFLKITDRSTTVFTADGDLSLFSFEVESGDGLGKEGVNIFSSLETTCTVPSLVYVKF